MSKRSISNNEKKPNVVKPKISKGAGSSGVGCNPPSMKPIPEYKPNTEERVVDNDNGD